MGKVIITIILLMAVFSQQAQAGVVDFNSFIKDGIEYYIQTDKSVYNLGEPVEILFKVTNLTDSVWEVAWPTNAKDISISEKIGQDFFEVWRHSWIHPVPPMADWLELHAGETWNFSVTWLQIDAKKNMDPSDDVPVPPGMFNISGIIYGINIYTHETVDESVTVGITIVPEPASVVLFGIGTLFLFRCKKTSKATTLSSPMPD